MTSVDDPWSDFEWGDDWEVVDPAAPPPPPPPPKTYVQQWADKGIPDDFRFARKLLMAERQRRRSQPKKKIWVQHSTKITKEVSDALYEIVEKYEVSLSKVVQKFIEDGIREISRSQSWPELAETAGLEERKPNPFDPLSAPAPVKETWTPAPVTDFVPPEIPVSEFVPLPAGVGPQVAQ